VLDIDGDAADRAGDRFALRANFTGHSALYGTMGTGVPRSMRDRAFSLIASMNADLWSV
jgi:hypothetical protein